MTTAAESRLRKPKKCRTCAEPFQPMSMTHVCCSIRCSVEFARTKREKAARKQLAADKAKAKTRGQWVKEVQVEFNKFIRARDRAAGHACISSGRALDWTGNNVDAGHYRSVGSAPHLRFDERNCHAQSKKDNRYGSGCAVDYRIGLIARIGLAAVEALEADQSTKHYSIEELKAMKAEYTRKRRELEKSE